MERHTGMTKKMNCLVVLATLASTRIATADTPRPPRVADARPLVSLERFLGSWKLTGTISMGADNAKITATVLCRRASAGAAIACSGKFTGVPGAPALEESDLMGYDPGTNTLHWYAVTNLGEVHDHVANVNADPTLHFVHTGTQDGQAFKEVIDVEFVKDGKSISLRSTTSLAGHQVAVLELKGSK